MPTFVPLPFKTTFQADSVNGKKTKSKAFLDVEKALEQYQASPGRHRLQALIDTLATWKLAKSDPKQRSAWRTSVRADAVALLDAWIIDEGKACGLFPLSRPLWGGKHNCYAYAMKCQDPQGDNPFNAWPGRMADRKEAMDGKFWLGVVDDAAAQRKQILRLPAQLPHPVPPRQPGGTYLAALLGNAYGFHFMRRRESTGLWSHKNAGHGGVETHFYDELAEKPVPITDEVAGRILADPLLIGCNMTFLAYLQVPAGGIGVKG